MCLKQSEIPPVLQDDHFSDLFLAHFILTEAIKSSTSFSPGPPCSDQRLAAAPLLPKIADQSRRPELKTVFQLLKQFLLQRALRGRFLPFTACLSIKHAAADRQPSSRAFRGHSVRLRALKNFDYTVNKAINHCFFKCHVEIGTNQSMSPVSDRPR